MEKFINLDISEIEIKSVSLKHNKEDYEHLLNNCTGGNKLIIFTYNLNIKLFKSILTKLNEDAEIILVFNGSTNGISKDEIKKTEWFFKELLTLHTERKLTTYLTYFNHAKFILTDHYIYLSSANFSEGSKNNLEFSIIGQYNNRVEERIREIIRYVSEHSIKIYLDESDNTLSLRSTLISRKTYKEIIDDMRKFKGYLNGYVSDLDDNDYWNLGAITGNIEEEFKQIQERLVDSQDVIEELLKEMKSYWDEIEENEEEDEYITEMEDEIESVQVKYREEKQTLEELLVSIEEIYQKEWSKVFERESIRANSDGILDSDQIRVHAEEQTVFEFKEVLRKNTYLIDKKLIPCLQSIKSIVDEATSLAVEIYEYYLKLDNTDEENLIFAYTNPAKFTKHLEILEDLKSKIKI
ncbi:hypothetical protein ABC255_02245 [Neobacillus sp. 3P2-tot-E-2]|uniref:hypothetical protein n=1 Tax=Neobacillus sp. 3P2-tot-E-2 TaxID=3132212 RepID=UPI0039A1C1F6